MFYDEIYDDMETDDLLSAIDHKIRHLRMIASVGSFASVVECDRCGGRCNTVHTPSAFSSCCSECGDMIYSNDGDNEQ